MKNRIKQYLSAASICVGLTACSDFFEPIPGIQSGLGETFASRQRTEEYLNNVYNYVREMTSAIHPNTCGDIFTEASLDGANRQNRTYAEWTNGSFSSASAQAGEYFSKYCQTITKASTFIQNVDKCTGAAASARGKWKSEARVLRAYYYFELLRLYGPIPLIGEDPIPLDASLEELIEERDSIDECINFIAMELQSATDSGDLLQRAGKANLERMGIATCMVLKTKLYLYQASPLFNGSTDQAPVKNKDGRQLFPQTEDSSGWTQARDACEWFMTFTTGQGYKLTEVYTNGKLDPYASCRAAGEFFTTTQEAVDELILMKPRNLYDYAYQVHPKFTDPQDTDVTGGGGYYTTQETVDLFFTRDGLTIEEGPGYDKSKSMPGTNNFTSGRYYDPSNPSRLYFDVDKSKVLKQWKDHEPRFYVNITHSGSTWLDGGRYNEEMCADFTNGTSGACGKSKASGDCPDPGYLIRRGTKASNNNGSKHSSPVLRLADMYLGYTGALCMCGDLNNALTYLNKIRIRTGIPEHTFTTTTGKIICPKTQTDLLNRVRCERLVELAFEWNRYLNVHHWKVAEGQNDPEHWIHPAYHTGGERGKVYGMSMDKDRPAFFERTSFEIRVAFTKRRYSVSIPYDDLRRTLSLIRDLG